MPIGYLVAVALVTWGTLFALSPLQPRHSSLSNRGYWFGFLINELPFVAFYWLLTSTLLALGEGDIGSPGSWAVVGLAALTTVGLAFVAWRGLRAGSAVGRALREGLGVDWGAAINAEFAALLRRHRPWARILFAPW